MVQFSQRKLLSAATVVVAVVTLVWVIWEQVILHRYLVEAAAQGAIIDVSPDQFQLNVRIVISLGVAGLCLWSNRGNWVGVIFATVVFGFCEVVFWSVSSPFDRKELEIHTAAIGTLTAALIISASGIRTRHLLNASLAAVFIFVNYAAWLWWTERLRRGAGVEELYPNTFLNRSLYGARPWHVAFLIFTFVMLTCVVGLLFKSRSQPSTALTT